MPGAITGVTYQRNNYVCNPQYTWKAQEIQQSLSPAALLYSTGVFRGWNNAGPACLTRNYLFSVSSSVLSRLT